MKPVTLAFVAAGAAGAVAAVALWRMPRQVELPVYEQSVRFFSEGKQSILVANKPRVIERMSAEACGRCHRKEYAEWKASAHSRSVTEPVFAAAFKAEPRVLCRSCHSPLIEQHPVLVHQMEGMPRVLIHGRSALPQGHPEISQGAGGQIAQGRFRRNPFQPLPFLTETNPDYDAALGAEGVTCVTCHVREGTILTANRKGLSNVPHPLSYSSQLRTADFCGGCHQFDIRRPQAHPFEQQPARVIPARLVRQRRLVRDPSGRVASTTTFTTIGQQGPNPPQDPEEPPVPSQPGLDQRYHQEARVQDTLAEFRMSPAALRGETCQTCHMPATGAGRMHTWEGRNSLAMLQKAVTLSTRLDRPRYVPGDTLQAVIRLKNDAGHRFPTGDSIHAGILDVWLRDGNKTLGRQVYVMSGPTGDLRALFLNERARMMERFGNRVADTGRIEGPNRSDSRLLPGEEAMLVFKQKVQGALASARNPVLRVRVFHSAVHPGFRGTSIDPKLNTIRLIREENIPVRIGPGEAGAEKPTAMLVAPGSRG